jgi:hypothetical protein
MKDTNTNSTKQQDSELLQNALWYVRHGYSIFPVRYWAVTNADRAELAKGKSLKVPLVKWEEFESRIAAEKEVCVWFKKWPNAAIGLVTGKISNLIVVDAEKEADFGLFGLDDLDVPTSKTGGGGKHYFFAYEPSKNAVKFAPFYDFRGDGGYVVVPPSGHSSGGQYEWIKPLGSVPLQPLPAAIREALNTPKKKGPKAVHTLLSGVKEGERNSAAAKVIGSILRGLSKEEWESHGWPQSKNWNDKNPKPLDESELRNTFDSIASREDKQVEDEEETEKRPKMSRRKKIARELIELSGIKLFRDSLGKSYALLKRERHNELWPCKGSDLEREIGLFWYERVGEPARGEDITCIAKMLDAKAQREGALVSVELRVARNATNGVDAIFYDLTDSLWRCVVVTKNGWNIEPHTNVYFRRYKHTKEQIIPVQGGDVRELLMFVNINNPDEQLLLLCYLISCFIPGMAHPILGLNGHKGSSKSTIMRMLKMIIDPSPLFTCSFPKDPQEIAMIFSQNWLAAFDNVSHIPTWLSDILCKVCTGDAFMKRSLFTNEDAHIVEYQQCVMLNGINNPAEKPDLLDRMIIFWIESISKEQRKPFDELWRDFMRALPRILGGVFTTLSQALAIKAEVNRDGLSRLADFDLWGRAIAKALGYTEQDFMRAMAANSETQNLEAIKQSPVALILIAWAEKVEPSASLEATATELLKWFKDKADKASIDTRAHDWPKNGAALSRKINEIALNLLENGIKVMRAGNGKKIIIQKVPKNSVNAANVGDNPADNNGINATDDVLRIFGGQVVDEHEGEASISNTHS